MNAHARLIESALAPADDTRPDATCCYCWPKWIVADFWDANGYACCNACGANWDRVCRMPKWSLREVVT